MPITMTAPLIEPAAIETYRRNVVERLERASLRTVATVSRRGQQAIRARMAEAGLGRLGNAVGSGSDDHVKRYSGDRFSVSAQFFVRSRSERTLGALRAYTEGALIAPVRGRWLWIPTGDAQRVVGSGTKKRRLTPATWKESGLEQKLGPLIPIKSVDGRPLLAVENVGVDVSGRKPSAKSLLKSGRARKGQIRRELVVMFVAIPRTSRAARVNLTEILNSVRAEMPAILAAEIEKEVR